MSSFSKKKLEKKRRKFAVARYILPFAAAILILILYCLPCFYFTDYSGSAHLTTSIFERMSDNFFEAREVLFSKNSAIDDVYKNFNAINMGVISASAICFVLGFLLCFLYALVGILHVSAPENSDRLRRIFVTFIPNNIVLSALSLLLLVPTVFPHALVKLIDRILMVNTKVHYVAGDILIYAFALWLIPTLFLVFTKKYETQELRIFAQKRKDEHEEEEQAALSVEENDLSKMTEKTKEEQIESLRKLLKINDEDK